MAYETTDQLIAEVADHWNKRDDTVFYQLLDIYNEHLTKISDEAQKIDRWRMLKEAKGTTLELLGQDRKAYRISDDDDTYRFIIFIHILMSHAQGTIPSMVKIMSTALNADPNKFEVFKTGLRHIGMKIPFDYVQNIQMQKFIIKNIQRLVAMGYWIDKIIFYTTTNVHGYLGAGTTDHWEYKDHDHSIWWTGWDARTFNHWYFGTGLHTTDKYKQKMNAVWWSGWSAKQELKRYLGVASIYHKESTNTLSSKWWTGWQSRAPTKQYVASVSSSLHESNNRSKAVWWTGWKNRSSLSFVLGLQSVTTHKQSQTAL